MPLIKCPDCDNMISPRAEKCPFCGCPASYFPDENIGVQDNVNEKENVQNAETGENPESKVKDKGYSFRFLDVVIEYDAEVEPLAPLFGMYLGNCETHSIRSQS